MIHSDVVDGELQHSSPSVPTSGIRLVLATLAILFALLGPTLNSSDSGLGYDEGDYYQAVAKGWMTNWTDRDDIAPSLFIAAGIRAVRGEAEKGELSRTIRSSGSTAFYRHFHPPIAFYPSIILRSLAPDLSPERTLRVASIIFMVGWILLILVLSHWRPTLFPWTIAILPATAHYIQSAAAFNMHIPFGLALLGMLLCWRAYLAAGSEDTFLRRGALIFFGIALCAVEYSLVLLGGVLLWSLYRIWVDRDHWVIALRRRLVDGLWVLGTIFLIWPGGILNLGLLKSYAHQAYIALFRLKDVPAGFSSPLDLIAGKFSPSPLDLLLLLLGLFVVARPLHRVITEGYRAVSVLLLGAILVLQINPSLVLPWYTFPIFAVAIGLYLSGDFVISSMPKNRLLLFGILVPSITFTVALFTASVESDSFLLDLKDVVEDRIPADLPIVADQRITPSLGGYFLTRKIVGYHMMEIPKEERADSLSAWKGRGAALILPIEFGSAGHDTVRDYVVDYPHISPEQSIGVP